MGRFLSACALASAATAGLGLSAPLSLTDRAGVPLPARVTAQLASLGVSGRTTLDARAQRSADEALDRGLAEARAGGLPPTGGSVVVLGIAERALLAIASVPDAGRALGAIPAGSVVKPIVAAAAIAHGLDPREPRPCPARFTADGATIRNWRPGDGPAVALPRAIAESCNTVFASLAADLWRAPDPGARAAIERTYRRFGFGVPTGMLPGEDIGRVPVSSPAIGDLMVLAIGQGPLSVTPLQVARAFAAIAGEPLERWLDIRGRELPVGIVAPGDDVLGPVREGLELAVRAGTARASFDDVALDRLPVAGKTGSAEIGDVTPYAWFAAYAPANRPRYVVTVVVERGRAGAISAAPIARRVLDDLLGLPSVRAPFPLPHAAAILLAVPLLAAFASRAAGALAGFAAGAAAAALAGGSVAAGGVTFAFAGWLAGVGAGTAWLLPLAAAAGSVGLPADGRSVGWIAARAAIIAAMTILPAFGLAMDRRRAPSAPY